MCMKNEQTALFLSNITVSKKSGESSCSGRPVFCEDGKSIVVCYGKSCHLYNISTGNHVKELFRCSSNIISHQLHPLEKFLLIAVTENGEITVYNLQTDETEHSVQLVIDQDILNAQKISKFDSENEDEKEFDWKTQPLDSVTHRKFLYAIVKPFQGNPSKILIWASWYLTDEIHAHISVFSLKEGKHKFPFCFRKSRLKKCFSNFALSKSQELDSFLGLSSHCVHIALFENKKSYYYFARKHYTGLNCTTTCVAFHPTENCFATGDTVGRITIWKNIFDKYPLKEIFHWHSSLVRDIMFSNFGNYIFSGGEENVLVKWSLTARKKQFLPRLSSAIYYISETSEASLISVSTCDTQILILDFNFQCISTIQHFSKWHALLGKRKLNLFTIDPRSDCIVQNGKTGHIQFLSVKDEGKLMYTFDVTNRNFITPSSNSMVANIEVTHAVFSVNGEWMITAENRSEALCKECRLKFWRFLSDKGSFVLNTNVEFPHGGDEIYCLEISADSMVVTTGPDNKFRMWTVSEHQIGNTVKDIWSIYRDQKYRQLPCYAIGFSNDSSLLAVTFSSVLTIWEARSCVLKCSLSLPNSKERLKVCKFGSCESRHLVVTATETTICCWNTITLFLVWTVPIRLSVLVSDPLNPYMTCISKDQTLVVFSPASPSPELVLKKVCDSPVLAGSYALNGCGKFCLYFLTEAQELFCVEGGEKTDETFVKYDEGLPETPYASHLAKIHNQRDRNKNEIVPILKSNQQFVSDLLNSPSHTLSNPSLLCCRVLKGLLLYSVSKSSRISLKKQKQLENVKIRESDRERNAHSEGMEIKLRNVLNEFFV